MITWVYPPPAVRSSEARQPLRMLRQWLRRGWPCRAWFRRCGSAGLRYPLLDGFLRWFRVVHYHFLGGNRGGRCRSLQIANLRAQLRQIGFFRTGQSLHPLRQRPPRSLQCAEIVLYGLVFILGAERSRRLDHRSVHVIECVQIAVELEGCSNVLRRSSQLADDFWKRHLQVTPDGFDVRLGAALGV